MILRLRVKGETVCSLLMLHSSSHSSNDPNRRLGGLKLTSHGSQLTLSCLIAVR